jgi:hypothetical protein
MTWDELAAALAPIVRDALLAALPLPARLLARFVGWPLLARLVTQALAGWLHRNPARAVATIRLLSSRAEIDYHPAVLAALGGTAGHSDPPEE